MQATAGVLLNALNARKNSAHDDHRFGEIGKLLPVAGVWVCIVLVYVEYVFVHCSRLLQLDIPAEARDKNDTKAAVRDLIVFHALTGMMLSNFVCCMLTFPGTVPCGKGWERHASDQECGAIGSGTGSGSGSATGSGSGVFEKKTTGDRRWCKWCMKYKPDRCHHCRTCNVCVLRMDHHCPWVYNCIGFRNHKYFFLLLFYLVLDLLYTGVTMFDSVLWSTRADVNMWTMVVLTAVEIIVIFLGVSGSCFFIFHCWLMGNAMTTLEFCEATTRKSGYDVGYNRSLYLNICAVLGDQPLLWCLPTSFPPGDGTQFPVRRLLT